MKYLLSPLLTVLLLVSCVPIVKYKQAQNELQKKQESNLAYTAKVDSLESLYKVLKADYNSLNYELGETQKYSSFTDVDLRNQLNKEYLAKEKFQQKLKDIDLKKSLSTYWSQTRAKAFAQDALCGLEHGLGHKFLLLKDHVVILDIEGLLSHTSNNLTLKASLINTFQLLKYRKDYKLSITLYQAGMITDWNKIKLQNEVLNFVLSEAGISSSQVECLTKVVSQEKSLELGTITSSRLLMEVDFHG